MLEEEGENSVLNEITRPPFSLDLSAKKEIFINFLQERNFEWGGKRKGNFEKTNPQFEMIAYMYKQAG